MSALVNSKRVEPNDRCIMVVLDDENYDIFKKVLSVYYRHILTNNLYATDLDGVCKKTCVHNLRMSAAMWRIIFKIINLAGYYIVHDVRFKYLWVVGTYEDIVADGKYVNYINLLNGIVKKGKEGDDNEQTRRVG